GIGGQDHGIAPIACGGRRHGRMRRQGGKQQDAATGRAKRMEHGAHGAPLQALSHRPSQNASRLRQRAATRGAELFHGCTAAWAGMPMNTYACAVRRALAPPTMPAAPPAGGSRHDDSRRGERLMDRKPRLSFWQIWNMCFGFLGIQFGLALQNANVSRIFQTLGADMEQVPGLWIAAPLTGLLVQPVVGYLSDRTWTRLGRRRPYFLAGAILATLALFVMPNSPALWIAAGTLWILDASINISMEPFRAFVGDQLPPAQRPAGF